MDSDRKDAIEQCFIDLNKKTALYKPKDYFRHKKERRKAHLFHRLFAIWCLTDWNIRLRR